VKVLPSSTSSSASSSFLLSFFRLENDPLLSEKLELAKEYKLRVFLHSAPSHQHSKKKKRKVKGKEPEEIGKGKGKGKGGEEEREEGETIADLITALTKQRYYELVLAFLLKHSSTPTELNILSEAGCMACDPTLQVFSLSLSLSLSSPFLLLSYSFYSKSLTSCCV
jgi:hypothetical protein